jgi:hypothetical protein
MLSTRWCWRPPAGRVNRPLTAAKGAKRTCREACTRRTMSALSGAFAATPLMTRSAQNSKKRRLSAPGLRQQGLF